MQAINLWCHHTLRRAGKLCKKDNRRASVSKKSRLRGRAYSRCRFFSHIDATRLIISAAKASFDISAKGSLVPSAYRKVAIFVVPLKPAPSAVTSLATSISKFFFFNFSLPCSMIFVVSAAKPTRI